MISTLKEIRDNIADTTREQQIDTLIDQFINLTLQEINDPAWAFEQLGVRGINHLWSFNRRKHTIATVASTESYQLPRDVDKIALVRQTSTPVKLRYLPDEVFYRQIPDPTATGNPHYYRIWEEEGLSTRLATDGTIDAVSDSTSDGSTFTVSVVGYDTNGAWQSEVLTLNGTTKVTGSKTFDAGRPIRISKSGKTTGKITVTAGSTTLLVMGAEERSPRFKVISFYKIPSAAITIYLEYYTRIRQLENNADVPDIDEKWIWVLRTGGLAKVLQYQGKSADFQSMQALYASGVRSMIRADMQEADYIPVLSRHVYKIGVVEWDSDGYGNYGLTF